MTDLFFLLLLLLLFSVAANVILYSRNTVLVDEYKEMSKEVKALLWKYEGLLGERDSSDKGKGQTVKRDI